VKGIEDRVGSDIEDGPRGSVEFEFGYARDDQAVG
jgi:hypothetical protein